MRLSQIKGTLSGEDVDIESVSFKSGEIGNACAYFCLQGKLDGHAYALQAQKNGAVAIVCERKLNDVSLPQIIVEDARDALAFAASAVHYHPEKSLKLIGITGTNGKTTTSFIISSILNEYGAKCGIIGTNGAFWCGNSVPLPLTTPDPPQLFSVLRLMVLSGVEYVIMEVSAHALALSKTNGIVFDVAAFTNLTQDHLDYFASMQEYAAAKAQLFTPQYAKSAVINTDDAFGRELIENCCLDKLVYGCNYPADVFAIDLKMSAYGLEYVLNVVDDIVKIKFSMTGRYNMYNTLCAASVARSLGVPVRAIADGIKKLKRVEGRYDIINTTKCSIIIDFAHTEDGLKNIISSIREYVAGKIITVFGCGGDRDKTKRPLMGRAAAALSDFCFVTSDNPRSEKPLDIINEIVAGITAGGFSNYTIEPDRKKAIELAINMANKDDIILIAGKGAEKYQEIMGEKIPYSDGECVLKYIESNKL